MSAPTVTVPAAAVDLTQWWRTTVTVAKTCVMILAVIGGLHITEPLRADAAASDGVQQQVEPAKPAKGAPGK